MGYLVPWVVGNLGVVVKVVEALAAVAISYYIARFISSRIVKARVKAPPEVVFNVAKAVKWLIISIGVLTALSIAGVELSELLVAVGFTDIVIGLAIQ